MPTIGAARATPLAEPWKPAPPKANTVSSELVVVAPAVVAGRDTPTTPARRTATAAPASTRTGRLRRPRRVAPIRPMAPPVDPVVRTACLTRCTRDPARDPEPPGQLRVISQQRWACITPSPDGKGDEVPKYTVNQGAVAHARHLIDAHQYVLDSDWGDVQPSADERERLSEAPTRGTSTPTGTWASPWAPTDETKARYAFVFGDFRRVHRTGLIACVYRASEWRHKDVELAAHDLLQHLDRTSR